MAAAWFVVRAGQQARWQRLDISQLPDVLLRT
jgi:hypothetical protein